MGQQSNIRAPDASTRNPDGFFLFFHPPSVNASRLINHSYNSGHWSGSLYGKTAIFPLWVDVEVAPPAHFDGPVHPLAAPAGASGDPARLAGNQIHRQPTMHRFPTDRRSVAFPP